MTSEDDGSNRNERASEPTHYTAEGVADLDQGYVEVNDELERLLTAVAENASRVANPRAKEFLLNGVTRRIQIIRRSLHNVFMLFPPSAVLPVDTDDLDDARISLHAFLINLCGLFDNLAWAFVWRHQLENTIDRNRVGLFLSSDRRN